MLFQAAVGIKCLCKPGFVGDGKDTCNGDVYSTLLTLSEASQFVKVSEASQFVKVSEALQFLSGPSY